MPSRTAFARLIVRRLQRSLGVNRLSYLKEEHGGSLTNHLRLVLVGVLEGIACWAEFLE
jgi:hypothetical protein